MKLGDKIYKKAQEARNDLIKYMKDDDTQMTYNQFIALEALAVKIDELAEMVFDHSNSHEK